MNNPQLKALEPLVGRWRSSGRTVPGPFGPAVTISGTDTYEWLDNGFLVHHVDVLMGDQRVRVIELIGEHDPTDGTWAMRAFDGQGTFSTMRASVDAEGVFTFTDGTMRATLTVADDGRTMSARWDRSDGGPGWQHWMDMSFVRAD
ncbi:hypothetical protein AB0H57_21230 [Micromonospora sp. NPDC050686]|uniref:hypothetical protein n=1 Tax=Micromonospora sp. NPDC050686 TaxID=3154631 RepID=UPI0033D60ED6